MHAHVHTQGVRYRARSRRSATFRRRVVLLLSFVGVKSASQCRRSSVLSVCANPVFSRLNEQSPRRYPRTRPPPSLPSTSQCLSSLRIATSRASLLRLRSGDYLRWRVFDLLNCKCQNFFTLCVLQLECLKITSEILSNVFQTLQVQLD